MTKKILLLGSTGSIGTRTLDVVRDFREEFSICGLSTYGRIDLIEKQIREFHPIAVNITNENKEQRGIKLSTDSGARITYGEEGLRELVDLCEPDIVVVATVGIAGLKPTLAAIEHGCDVALANKEVLVTGGSLVTGAARKKGMRIMPIDSEHNAVMQCLMGQDPGRLRRIILTASGGPFRTLSLKDLEHATPDQALNHPTWRMGPKITIDSATMMNKGFEVIEGHHLFNVPPEKIEVVIHPQSVIHSLVEFVDGSLLAQLSVTDMYLTIQNALLFPRRLANKLQTLDLTDLEALTFEKPDLERFPCLGYAYEALDAGGTASAALNAANEVAVRRFLAGEIPFLHIPRIIQKALEKHEAVQNPSLDQILETDQETRRIAEKL